MAEAWSSSRIGKPPEVLLEFHSAMLEKVQTDRQIAYHTERVRFLSSLVHPEIEEDYSVSVAEFAKGLVRSNVVDLETYRASHGS